MLNTFFELRETFSKLTFYNFLYILNISLNIELNKSKIILSFFNIFNNLNNVNTNRFQYIEC